VPELAAERRERNRAHDCSRASRPQPDTGAVLLLPAQADYPRELLFKQVTRRVIRGKDRAWPEPQSPIAMDPQGNLYAASASHAVSLHSGKSDGTFRKDRLRAG
jgi:hypothetical protein